MKRESGVGVRREGERSRSGSTSVTLTLTHSHKTCLDYSKRGCFFEASTAAQREEGRVREKLAREGGRKRGGGRKSDNVACLQSSSLIA